MSWLNNKELQVENSWLNKLNPYNFLIQKLKGFCSLLIKIIDYDESHETAMIQIGLFFKFFNAYMLALASCFFIQQLFNTICPVSFYKSWLNFLKNFLHICMLTINIQLLNSPPYTPPISRPSHEGLSLEVVKRPFFFYLDFIYFIHSLHSRFVIFLFITN